VSYGLPPNGLPNANAFQGWVAAAAYGRRKAVEVSIHVADGPEGQALNLKYRHKDYPTNVMSFQAELPEGVDVPLIGDVVLCAPVIAKEAHDQGKTLEQHYAHLTVHGVLHLLGLDHETVAEARAMEAAEIQVLESIGIPDPYGAR
jgi:probable rRNA maturation factor